MENPATWTDLERAIDEALREAEEGRQRGRVGWSTAKQIAEKLRERGLVRDEERKADV